MEADEQATKLDGCYPPGDRFLKVDPEPILWERLDPLKPSEYVSINELVSQNNLRYDPAPFSRIEADYYRLAEWYARILASGGDIGDVHLRSVEECVNDARYDMHYLHGRFFMLTCFTDTRSTSPSTCATVQRTLSRTTRRRASHSENAARLKRSGTALLTLQQSAMVKSLSICTTSCFKSTRSSG